MPNLDQLDQLYMKWAQAAAERDADGRDINAESVADWFGLPSTWEPRESYLEEIEHVLNDGTDDFPTTPLPPEIIAYRLSLWLNSPIGVDHPLVRNARHWRDVSIAMGFGDASAADEKQLYILVSKSCNNQELSENLGNFDEFRAHAERERVEESEGVKITKLPNGDVYYIAVVVIAGQQSVAFLNNNTGAINVFTFDGDKVPIQQSTGIQSYILQAPKQVIEFGELATSQFDHSRRLKQVVIRSCVL